MPNKNKNHVFFFYQQYPKQIYLKFYTVKMKYPKYMLHIKIFSLSLWLSWTETEENTVFFDKK